MMDGEKYYGQYDHLLAIHGNIRGKLAGGVCFSMQTFSIIQDLNWYPTSSKSEKSGLEVHTELRAKNQ